MIFVINNIVYKIILNVIILADLKSEKSEKIPLFLK